MLLFGIIMLLPVGPFMGLSRLFMGYWGLLGAKQKNRLLELLLKLSQFIMGLLVTGFIIILTFKRSCRFVKTTFVWKFLLTY